MLLLSKQKNAILVLLQILFFSGIAIANGNRFTPKATSNDPLLGSVTTSPSSLLFSAVQGVVPDSRNLTFVISGVSSSAVTTLTAPVGFHFEDSRGNGTSQQISITGNGNFVIFVRFEGNANVGTFSGDIKFTGAEISPVVVPVSAAVAPNPSLFPSTLIFDEVEGQSPLPKEVTITISNLSATAQTIVKAPDFFQILSDPNGITGKIITFTGNGVFKFFVTTEPILDPGVIKVNITVSGSEIQTKLLPVQITVRAKATPTVNPTSLSGFTAVEGGNASAVQSFLVSVNGLPSQGSRSITVTAPKGYSIGLASTSFGSAFVVFASNGSILNRKIFVRLNSTNPVGAVNGNVTITGNEINNVVVPLKGTITPKPAPSLTVDKTSLSGFLTTTNKPSIAQSYLLKAANLPPNVAASVKAPVGYELSLTNASNSIFSSQLTVLQVGGSINATVFVRLKSQPTAGNIAGIVQNTVAGITKNVNVSGTVIPPPVITVNPTSLSGLNTVKNQASASKTYTFSASNLAAGLTATIKAPANYQLRIQGVGSFVDSIKLTQTSTGSINRTIEVRLKAIATTGTISGSIQNVVAGVTRFVSVTGVVAAPTLATSLTSLTFTAVKNQPSLPKSYKLTATNIATGLQALVTASAGYEISLQANGTFTSSLSLPQNGTNSISTDVFVRLKATATTGTIAGTIQQSVSGLTKTVTLSSTVAAPALSVNPAILNGFSTVQNQPSLAKTYNFIASNLVNGINATITAPAGYEIALQGTSAFSSTLTLAQTSTGFISRTILVRLKAQAANASVTGNIVHNAAGLTKTVALSGTVKPATVINSQSKSQPDAASAELQFTTDEFAINTYPNPATNQLNVEFISGPGDVDIKLLDMQGVVLIKRRVGSEGSRELIVLSLAGLKSGMYMLELTAGAKHKVVPVVKQ